MRRAALFVLAAFLWFPNGSVTAQGKVYSPGKDGVTHPVVVKEVKPRYPQEALKEGKGTVVILECVVTREGLPAEVRVQKPGDRAFDEAAVKALRKWEFKPGTKDGKPVPVLIEVELTFTAKK